MGWCKMGLPQKFGRAGNACTSDVSGNRKSGKHILKAVLVDRPGPISKLPEIRGRRGDFGGRYLYR